MSQKGDNASIFLFALLGYIAKALNTKICDRHFTEKNHKFYGVRHLGFNCQKQEVTH